MQPSWDALESSRLGGIQARLTGQLTIARSDARVRIAQRQILGTRATRPTRPACRRVGVQSSRDCEGEANAHAQTAIAATCESTASKRQFGEVDGPGAQWSFTVAGRLEWWSRGELNPSPIEDWRGLPAVRANHVRCWANIPTSQ